MLSNVGDIILIKNIKYYSNIYKNKYKPYFINLSNV